MIEALKGYDKKRAMGILALTSLSLCYETNSEIQASVLKEIRARLGIPMDDDSEDARARIVDVLDSESDQLLRQLK